MFYREAGFAATGFQFSVVVLERYRTQTRSLSHSETPAFIGMHLPPINQDHAREAGVSSLSGCATGGLCSVSRECGLEFDSLRKGSVGWGVWFEFAGFNGCVDVPL